MKPQSDRIKELIEQMRQSRPRALWAELLPHLDEIELLRQHGIRQMEIAAALGVSPRTLYAALRRARQERDRQHPQVARREKKFAAEETKSSLSRFAKRLAEKEE